MSALGAGVSVAAALCGLAGREVTDGRQDGHGPSTAGRPRDPLPARRCSFGTGRSRLDRPHCIPCGRDGESARRCSDVPRSVGGPIDGHVRFAVAAVVAGHRPVAGKTPLLRRSVVAGTWRQDPPCTIGVETRTRSPPGCPRRVSRHRNVAAPTRTVRCNGVSGARLPH